MLVDQKSGSSRRFDLSPRTVSPSIGINSPNFPTDSLEESSLPHLATFISYGNCNLLHGVKSSTVCIYGPIAEGEVLRVPQHSRATAFDESIPQILSIRLLPIIRAEVYRHHRHLSSCDEFLLPINHSFHDAAACTPALILANSAHFLTYLS